MGGKLMPLSFRLYAILAGTLALMAGLYWYSDTIGDARELKVRDDLISQELRQHEAAEKGRVRARDCHALGPDRLWNVETEHCDRIEPALHGARP